MTENVTRFPLQWPANWPRTLSHQRQRAAFSASSARLSTASDGRVLTRRVTRALTVSDAIARLVGELKRLGASHEVLSTNVITRLDGLPRSGQGEPHDPGAAVYFRLKGKPRALACDRWNRVADNIAAVAQHIDALRRIERYGVGTMEQAFAGYAALQPDPASDWRIVLGLNGNATRDAVEASFRRLAATAHPDHGGSHDAMARLNIARDAALMELAS